MANARTPSSVSTARPRRTTTAIATTCLRSVTSSVWTRWWSCPGTPQILQRAYGDADIGVLTSISEGFPYATLEAMGCGKPVVATAVGGLPEQLGECGVLVEPQSPEALAAALVDLISDPSARARLGADARERVRATFNLEQQNRPHLEAYAAATDGAATRLESPQSEAAQTHEVAALSEAVTGALVASICSKEPHPVDHREIAAVLEANGVTDATAHARSEPATPFNSPQRSCRVFRAPATGRR